MLTGRLRLAVFVAAASVVSVMALGVYAFGEPDAGILPVSDIQQENGIAVGELPDGATGQDDVSGTAAENESGNGNSDGANSADAPSESGTDGNTRVDPIEDDPADGDNPTEGDDPVPGLKVEGSSITFIGDDGNAVSNTWEKVDDRWYYFGANGQALRDGVQRADGKLYLFDARGQMQSGTKTWPDGSWSKFAPQSDGKAPALTGFSREGENTYYYSPATGKTVRWAQTIDGKLYYFDGSYRMYTGWLTWNADGSKSFFASNGQAQSGFMKQGSATYYMSPSTFRSVRWAQTIGGALYYFSGDYQMYTGGWITWKADGTKSYFASNGKALTGWQKISGSTYYFNPSNARAVKWQQKIGNYWYYFNGKCQMHTGWLTWNADKSKSYFDASGRAVTGWQKLGGSTYYFDPSTARSVKWARTIDGADYYFNGNGQMVTGPVRWKSDGTTSVFASNGKMVTSGWAKANGATYFVSSNTKRAVKWQQKIGDYWYYFDGNCKMQTGWVKWNGVREWSYFDSDGRRVSGTQKIGDQTFKFDSNGRTKTEPITMPAAQREMLERAQHFSSDTSWLILVDRDTRHVGIFRGSEGNWRYTKYWLCCVGKPSTPTITGTYRVSGKGLSFGQGYTCWYYTQIKGNYLFHSVSYLPGSKTQLLDGRLGIANSHGCVRLEISNAKWMYDNVPYGSKIFIY